MTQPLPPKPALQGKKPSRIKRFFQARHSSLALFTEHSYAMKMGEVRGLRDTTYFLVQPDLLRRLLTSSPDLHPKSRILETLLEQLVGNGSFVSIGPEWERRRGMVDQAFQAANIAKTFPHMQAAAQDLHDRLPTGDVDIDTYTTFVAADIIFRTLFSESFVPDESAKLFDAFQQFQTQAFAHGTWRMAGLPERLSPYRRKARPYARILREALATRIDARLATPTPQADLLNALIAARDDTNTGFTREELIDEVAVMFLAGHETTANALAWSFYLLATHPAIQTRVQEEIDAALQGQTLSPGHFKRLPLVRDVFRETLRLYPPIAFVPRLTTQAETWRDKRLKPGATIFASLWLLHRHKTVWKAPDAFDPDRFATPEGKASARVGYLPFSIGPRVCPGASFALQEAAIVMATLLGSFTFTPTAGHTPRPVAKLTLRSENGIHLTIKRRVVDD